MNYSVSCVMKFPARVSRKVRLFSQKIFKRNQLKIFLKMITYFVLLSNGAKTFFLYNIFNFNWLWNSVQWKCSHIFYPYTNWILNLHQVSADWFLGIIKNFNEYIFLTLHRLNFEFALKISERFKVLSDIL